MPLLIRSATRKDADAVLSLRRCAILRGCAGHYPKSDLAIWAEGDASERFLVDLERHGFLAEAEGRLVGSGMVNLADGQIDAIFTHPDWMGQGIASAMMAHLESLARANGLQQLTLEATLNAAPFYRRCGFVASKHSEYHSPRGVVLPCIVMAKPLG